jgi:hypothetical protein
MSRAQRNFALTTMAAGALLSGGWYFLNHHADVPETEIYRGVTYQCINFPRSAEISGAMHVVIADLSAPGVGLYVTPMDETARKHGWEYRLDYVARVVRRERLAVAINGGYFAADSRFVDSAGDYAVSTEVTIADHKPCHVNLNSYMLWFDDNLTPHVQYTKPPPAEALRRAKWAVSSQMVMLAHGVVSAWADHNCAKRTAIGFNASTRKLYLAVFEYASPSMAAELLLKLGATDAVTLDGGGSTAMALGPDAKNVSPGAVLGGWRPVATMIGIRADPLR